MTEDWMICKHCGRYMDYDGKPVNGIIVDVLADRDPYPCIECSKERANWPHG